MVMVVSDVVIAPMRIAFRIGPNNIHDIATTFPRNDLGVISPYLEPKGFKK